MSCKQSTMKLLASSSCSTSSIDCAGLVLLVAPLALLWAVLIVSVLLVVAGLVQVEVRLEVIDVATPLLFKLVEVDAVVVVTVVAVGVLVVVMLAAKLVLQLEPMAAEGGAEEILVPE